jgi:hypothetical protein
MANPDHHAAHAGTGRGESGHDAAIDLPAVLHSLGARRNDPLYRAVAALPRTSSEMFAWLRDHRLGLGAGVGVVLLAVRADLHKAAGLNPEEKP